MTQRFYFNRVAYTHNFIRGVVHLQPTLFFVNYVDDCAVPPSLARAQSSTRNKNLSVMSEGCVLIKQTYEGIHNRRPIHLLPHTYMFESDNRTLAGCLTL